LLLLLLSLLHAAINATLTSTARPIQACQFLSKILQRRKLAGRLRRRAHHEKGKDLASVIAETRCVSLDA